MRTTVAAWAPLIAVVLGIVVYGVVSVWRGPVRWLPRWAWTVVCLVAMPWGAIVFLLFGRGES